MPAVRGRYTCDGFQPDLVDVPESSLLYLLVQTRLGIHGIVVMNANLLPLLPNLYFCVFFVLLQGVQVALLRKGYCEWGSRAAALRIIRHISI